MPRRRAVEASTAPIGRLLRAVTTFRTTCTWIDLLSTQVRITAISVTALVLGASVVPSTSV